MQIIYGGFEAFMAVMIQVKVFWNLCGRIPTCQRSMLPLSSGYRCCH